MTKRNPRKVFVKSKLKLKHLNLRTGSFLKSITTLHGMNYFAIKKGRSLLAWNMLMMMNIIWTVSFLVIIKDRYNTNQIVTKIYSDFAVNKLPFPAISICNLNLVSQRESVAIEKILLKDNVPTKEIESFLSVLPLLKDFDYDFGTYKIGNYSRIMQILKKHYYFNMEIVMKEVHQQCESLLLYCEFNGKEKDCKKLFTEIQTSEGHCCTFNYDGVDAENEDPMVIHDDDFDYYMDEDSDGDSVQTSLIATSQSGSTSGLKVLFNVEPGDYADWSLTPVFGAKVLLSDPNDFPETRVLYKYIDIGETVDMKVEPSFYNSEPSLRAIEPEKRGCWFHDEVNLINTDRYSYETCNTECRIKSYLEFCGCVPYKYPVDKSNRICELADLSCLHYMRVIWSSSSKKCVPECYKECRDKEYRFVSDTTPFFPDEFPVRITQGHNISELSSVHVYYMQSTCNCYTMSQLMDFNYFIATYGGIFSLSFGASIVTIFELVYLLLSPIIKTIWLMAFGVITKSAIH